MKIALFWSASRPFVSPKRVPEIHKTAGENHANLSLLHLKFEPCYEHIFIPRYCWFPPFMSSVWVSLYCVFAIGSIRLALLLYVSGTDFRLPLATHVKVPNLISLGRCLSSGKSCLLYRNPTSTPAHDPPADVRITRARVVATIPGYILGRNPPGDPARTVIWRRFITWRMEGDAGVAGGRGAGVGGGEGWGRLKGEVA